MARARSRRALKGNSSVSQADLRVLAEKNRNGAHNLNLPSGDPAPVGATLHSASRRLSQYPAKLRVRRLIGQHYTGVEELYHEDDCGLVPLFRRHHQGARVLVGMLRRGVWEEPNPIPGERDGLGLQIAAPPVAR